MKQAHRRSIEATQMCATSPDAAALPSERTCDPAAERIRLGDRAAFERLFRELAPALCAFLAPKYVSSRADAEDVIQDVFCTLWTQRDRIRVHGSFRNYVFTAARNRALSLEKHERVRDKHARISEAEDEPVTAADIADEAELATALHSAIQALPPRCREIFTLHRRSGLTQSAIARSLGLSIKTVETQIGRAIKMLRRSLKPYL
jgi:RNA polymerase sigma-70 factor (ECF subfamily)